MVNEKTGTGTATATGANTANNTNRIIEYDAYGIDVNYNHPRLKKKITKAEIEKANEVGKDVVLQTRTKYNSM